MRLFELGEKNEDEVSFIFTTFSWTLRVPWDRVERHWLIGGNENGGAGGCLVRLVVAKEGRTERGKKNAARAP